MTVPVQAATGLPLPSEPALAYTVKPTDQLSILTRSMLIRAQDWSEVARFNKLPDANKIYPKQTLLIPLRLLRPQAAPVRVVAVQGSVYANGQSIAVGQTLAEGSRIETRPDSSVVLELADGSQMKMLPTSLAEVTQNRYYALRDASQSASTNWYSGMMRLVQGGMDVLASKHPSRATPLQVETPTSLIGVRGTVFRVAYDDTAQRLSRSEVVEGKVRADNTAQASGADLAAGYGAVIDPAVKTVKAVALLPAPDVSSSPSALVKPANSVWSFSPVVGAVGYRIQIAADAQFNQLLRDLRSQTPSANLASLPPGSWHVRVRAVDAQGLEGFDAAKGVVLTHDATPPVLVHPTLSLKNGRSLFRFQLTPEAAAGYTAKIAQDPQFVRVLQQSPLTGQDWSVEGLKSGVYYLRLEGIAPGARSQTYQFELPENWGDTVFDSVGGLTLVQQ